MAIFQLDTEENKALKKWNKNHLRRFHDRKEPYSGAIGGRLQFSVTQTSLGIIVHAECAICRNLKKEFKDYAGCLTNFDNW